MKRTNPYINNWAYTVGLAIGDGNLTNPNGRAVRLRITCDVKYPLLIERIKLAVQKLLPNNKVNLVLRPGNCIDVSAYSNQLENLLGWQAKKGSKFKQNVQVPTWIKENKEFSILCLQGLFETDGSIYNDRNYPMANFVTIIPNLAEDVVQMIRRLGFTVNCYKIRQRPPHRTRYNIRVSKDTQKFIDTIGLNKS